jgi:hypothetical protein
MEYVAVNLVEAVVLYGSECSERYKFDYIG